MKPARLRHAVGYGMVLRLSIRTIDDIDEVVVQKHRVARSRPASVRTTYIVSVSVDEEL
jgi:hypothetical protein